MLITVTQRGYSSPPGFGNFKAPATKQECRTCIYNSHSGKKLVMRSSRNNYFKSPQNSPAFLEKGLIPAEEAWDGNMPGGATVGGGAGQRSATGGICL